MKIFFGIYFQPTSQFYSYFSIRGPGLPTTFTQLSSREFDVQECQRNTNRVKKDISVVSKTLSEIHSTPWYALGVCIQCAILSAIIKLAELQ